MNELVDVDITYDPQSQSVIVKNKEDGSVLSILDISEASDFMARINRMIAAAPKLYELAEAVAKLPNEQCMISPLIHEARKLITSIDGKEAEHD